MSSVYVLEPPTKGKVILHTTAGPLDVELWPKEAPKSVRNFVQLCLEGYYDNTIFHRIIKGFMAQGGDPTGTGRGGETIYGKPFPDEFHSRLRFSHRGLVACANANTPNSNNSQFFITLDHCEWLDKKNTIFGKVTGDTIFNLLKLGEADTDKDDRPTDPVPKILSIEVLWNPFDDIFPRNQSKKSSGEETNETRKSNNDKKKVKKLNLLSFGEEAEQEEQELAIANIKIQSSHDVLNDPRLLKSEKAALEVTGMQEKCMHDLLENLDVNELETQDEAERKKRKEVQSTVRGALSSKRQQHSEKLDHMKEDTDRSDAEDEIGFDTKMRLQVLEKRKMLGHEKPTRSKADVHHVEESSDQGKARSSLQRKDEEEESISRREKLVIKRKGIGSEAKADRSLKAHVDAELLAPAEQQRYLNKQKKRERHGREESTLAKLADLQSRLKKAKEIQSIESEAASASEEDDSGFFAHKLKFSKEPGKKDDMARNEDPNQYTVFDPLLEKGKEKFNKMQAKMKRKNREWAGRSIT